MNKATSRRALLHVGALSGVVAASGLVLPALARDTKKTGAEETISPPEDLMREHAVLDRILLVYEGGHAARGPGRGHRSRRFSNIPPASSRDFIHDYHEKSEEELIFPRFKTAGRMVELVNVLVVQHGAGRKLTERILAAAPQTRNREPREAMGRDIQAFIAMYRPHMPRARRRTCSPPCASSSPADEYEGMADEMDKRERQAFGADGFEKIAKKVAEIETVIGIHDLDVFTPKS